MNLRAALRIVGLILLFLACLPLHLFSKLVGRSPWPRRFLAAAAWIVGARIRLEGGRPGRHTLLVSNHLSWIDILALAGSTGCAFVSKDTLGHPFIHWLADQNRTIYVHRSNRRGAKDQALAIAAALEREQPVALFPEGTTGPGTHLLPFRSTLLEAATFAAKDVAICPVALDYSAAATEVAWYQESGRDNVLRLLSRPGPLPLTVRVLPPITGNGRKALAEQARLAIESALAASSSPRARL